MSGITSGSSRSSAEVRARIWITGIIVGGGFSVHLLKVCSHLPSTDGFGPNKSLRYFGFFAKKQTLSPVENGAMYGNGMHLIEFRFWPFRDRLYPPEPQSTVIVHCTTEHQILGLAILPSTETNSTFAVTQKRGDYCNQEAHVDVRFNEPTGNHISISRSPLRPKLSMQRSSFRLYLSTTCSTVEMPTF